MKQRRTDQGLWGTLPLTGKEQPQGRGLREVAVWFCLVAEREVGAVAEEDEVGGCWSGLWGGDGCQGAEKKGKI